MKHTKIVMLYDQQKKLTKIVYNAFSSIWIKKCFVVFRDYNKSSRHKIKDNKL